MGALIGRLVPIILRHLEAYAEVVGEDAREAAHFVVRRLLALVVAGVCAFVAILMLCAWILVLAWDTDWRVWTAAGLAIAFAAAAAGLAWPALKRRPPRDTLFFHRIRTEIGRDRELIARAFDGREQAGNGSEQRPE